jgi:RNA-directed DNA polymerase
MNTAFAPLYEWKTIPWAQVERAVFKLQKRSYQAARRGDVRAVRRLQRLLVRSRSARLLAVRRVTQDNRGKRTAGVDGVKLLTPPQRLKLAAALSVPTSARPVRRVRIPKPGTTEERLLGIPTMHDRAAQALLKLALEPEWEARFEPNSYGFRPGRSCHDAIGAIFNAIRDKSKFVLDADIAKCFDRIDQTALLAKLDTTPTFRRAIRAWLRAGVMDGERLFPTEEGAPQGGVLSPLLMNVALHGLETALRSPDPDAPRAQQRPPTVIRYADDFVVLHEDRDVVEKAQARAADWLRGMGLELKPSKTRITHTLRAEAGSPGFDFLGFTVRQFPTGKRRTTTPVKSEHTRQPRGFKTLIKPSRTAMARQARATADVIRRNRAATHGELIAQLNPRIRGWAGYYRAVVASESFRTMDHVVYFQLWSWARFRHPRKSGTWIATRYWHPELGRWTFADNDGKQLDDHSSTAIQRHIKVRGDKSPYDGDWGYWATRTGRHPELPGRVSRLLRVQQGRCAACRLAFTAEDVWEIGHIIPRAEGGQHRRDNWQLLHGHCHDAKTAADAVGAHDKGYVTEEPDEVKISRPVLETSRSGD